MMRDSDVEKISRTPIAGWTSLVFGALAFADVTYVKVQHIFDCGNCAQLLIQISFGFVSISVISGLLGFRSWCGKTGLILSVITIYLLFFTRLYFLS